MTQTNRVEPLTLNETVIMLPHLKVKQPKYERTYLNYLASDDKLNMFTYITANMIYRNYYILYYLFMSHIPLQLKQKKQQLTICNFIVFPSNSIVLIF